MSVPAQSLKAVDSNHECLGTVKGLDPAEQPLMDHAGKLCMSSLPGCYSLHGTSAAISANILECHT